MSDTVTTLHYPKGSKARLFVDSLIALVLLAYAVYLFVNRQTTTDYNFKLLVIFTLYIIYVDKVNKDMRMLGYMKAY